MNIGKAVAICDNLDSEEHSIEDKLHAIHEVMNMPTHMGVKKDTLIGMIKWLWNFNLEVSESHNGKRIVEIPTPHGRLIDADRLIAVLKSAIPYEQRTSTVLCMIKNIENAPTIIEAEDGE